MSEKMGELKEGELMLQCHQAQLLSLSPRVKAQCFLYAPENFSHKWAVSTTAIADQC